MDSVFMLVEAQKDEIKQLKAENERLREENQQDKADMIKILRATTKDADRWRTGVGLNLIDMKTVQRINVAMKGGE